MCNNKLKSFALPLTLDANLQKVWEGAMKTPQIPSASFGMSRPRFWIVRAGLHRAVRGQAEYPATLDKWIKVELVSMLD